MTNCGKNCGACPDARRTGSRTFCIFYGIPIWGRKRKHEETTTRNDQDLRGLRERDHPDPRMDV